MCLAVPLRITKIEGQDAQAERNGVSRKIRLDFIKNPKIGDFVIVHAGFAIEKLDERQAEEDIKAAEEIENELAKLYT